MADYVCTIDGVERQVRRGTLRLIRRVNVRPTLELEIQSLDGSYIPPEGGAIRLTENAADLFGGRVEHPATGGIDGEPVEAIATRIDCVDQSAIADDLYLRTTFPGGTVKQFLQWVIDGYLGVKGTTLDPGQVDGPILPAVPYTYRAQKLVSAGLTDMCAVAVGWTWNVSASNVLSASPPGALVAPFDIADGDWRAIGDVRLEATSEQYGNRVIVVGNDALIVGYKDDLTSRTDGTRVTFPLALTPPGELPHLPNAGVVWVQADTGGMVQETLGLANATWIYDPASNTITDTGDTYPADVLNPGGVTAYRPFPLPALRPVWLVYDGTPLAIAIAEDTVAQAGPRGVVERIITNTSGDQAVLDAAAQAELIKALATPDTVTYDTDELGLAPGMIQTITEPLRGISGQFLIQQIETRDIENVDPDDDTPLLRHTVTAVEYAGPSATAYPGTVGDLYTQWSAGSSGGTAAPSISTGPALTIPGQARQMLFNDAGVIGAAPDALYDKDGTGDRLGVDAVPARLTAAIDGDGLAGPFTSTTTPALSQPAAAAGVAITPNAAAWANSAWVELVAATGAPWTIGHLAARVGVAAEFEFDLGVGAAGAEVVVGTLAGFSGAPSFTGFTVLRFPCALGPVAAGARIAVRLRKSGTDVTAWRAAIGYWPGTPIGTLSRSAVAPITIPSAASGVAVTPSGADWTNGAYMTLVAATPGALTAAYLSVMPGTQAESAYEIDLAQGAAGAEVVLATLRGDTEAGFWDMGPGVLSIWPLRSSIPAGVRLAVRIRKKGTNTNPWRVKLGGYVGFDVLELVTGQAQAARPAAADSLTVTTAGTVALPGAWVTVDPALAAAFAVVAIVPTGGSAYQIDVDLGYGPTGAEVLATTFRASGDSGNSTGVVRLAYACVIPAGARLVARAVGLDLSSTGRAITVAVVGVPAPDFRQQSPAGQSVWPDRAGGIGNPQVAAAWANSAYAALVADSGAAVEVITGLAIYAGFGDESEIDLAFGAAGLEVVATTIRLAGEGNATSHHPYLPLDAPLVVPAHTRVSYRTRRNANATTQAWTIALTHTPAVLGAGNPIAQVAIENRTAGKAAALVARQTNDGENRITATGGIHLTTPTLDLNGNPVVTAAAALAADRLVLGAGGPAVKAIAGAGSATSVLHGNPAGPPAFGPVDLAAEITGRLAYANLVAAPAGARLLGRGAGAAGDWQPIDLSADLTMVGTTLGLTTPGGGGTGTAGQRSLTCTFDGQGAAIAVGSKIYAYIPYGFTITDATIVADVVGAITFDVWIDTLANYPPTVADTIINTGAGGVKPKLTSADHAGALPLANWTTVFTGARAIVVNVDACTGITKAQLVLTVSADSAGSGTVTHTGALTPNAIVLGNGGADLTALASLGASASVLHGNPSGPPTFGPVALGAEVTGRLPYANVVPATAAARVLGRGSASGAGDLQELTLSADLAMAGTVLGLAAPPYVPPEWIAVPFNAADFTASGSMTWTVAASNVVVFAYRLEGRTMTVSFLITTTTIGGTPDQALLIKIPAGKSSYLYQHVGYLAYFDPVAGAGLGMSYVIGSNQILLYRGITGGNWSLGSPCYVYGQITFDTN